MLDETVRPKKIEAERLREGIERIPKAVHFF
jgi:hypothetical protein